MDRWWLKAMCCRVSHTWEICEAEERDAKSWEPAQKWRRALAALHPPVFSWYLQAPSALSARITPHTNHLTGVSTLPALRQEKPKEREVEIEEEESTTNNLCFSFDKKNEEKFSKERFVKTIRKEFKCRQFAKNTEILEHLFQKSKNRENGFEHIRNDRIYIYWGSRI